MDSPTQPTSWNDVLDLEQFTQSHELAHWQALVTPAQSRLTLAIADLEQAVDVGLAADVEQEEIA